MPQVSRSQLEPLVYEKLFSILHSVIIRVHNTKEADLLISDLLTPTEKIMIAKRLAIAYMILEGFDYKTISLTLKVSTATIATVKRHLLEKNNGYSFFVNSLMRDEILKIAFEELLLKVVHIAAGVRKGGGLYRDLERRLNDKKRKRII